jgi:hypothetical protein
MRAFALSLRDLVLHTEAQDLIEYGMLVGLIAVIAIVAVTAVGNTVNTVFWQTFANVI